MYIQLSTHKPNVKTGALLLCRGEHEGYFAAVRFMSKTIAVANESNEFLAHVNAYKKAVVNYVGEKPKGQHHVRANDNG